jgi:hypothetical protein
VDLHFSLFSVKKFEFRVSFGFCAVRSARKRRALNLYTLFSFSKQEVVNNVRECNDSCNNSSY